MVYLPTLSASDILLVNHSKAKELEIHYIRHDSESSSLEVVVNNEGVRWSAKGKLSLPLRRSNLRLSITSPPLSRLETRTNSDTTYDQRILHDSYVLNSQL